MPKTFEMKIQLDEEYMRKLFMLDEKIGNTDLATVTENALMKGIDVSLEEMK